MAGLTGPSRSSAAWSRARRCGSPRPLSFRRAAQSCGRRHRGGAARAAARAFADLCAGRGTSSPRLFSRPISRASPLPLPRRRTSCAISPRRAAASSRPRIGAFARRAAAAGASCGARRFRLLDRRGLHRDRARRQRQPEEAAPRRLARLEAAGIALVRVPGAALQQQGERLLADILPPPSTAFGQELRCPRARLVRGLGEIVAGDRD